MAKEGSLRGFLSLTAVIIAGSSAITLQQKNTMYVLENWLHCRSVTLLSEMSNATFLRSHGLRVVATKSEFKPDEINDLLDNLSTFSGINKQTPTICDLRKLNFTNVSTSTVKQWVSASIKHAELQLTPGACLVSSTLGFGMMRMFQVLNDLNGGAPENRTYVT